MVGDSTELTFVRCPSCRSLVPAISTKCRMCGATFDASQEVEEKPRIPSTRVRQQTTSVASTRDESSEPPIRPDSSGALKQPSNLATESGRQAMPDVDDPLRGYVEEVSIDPANEHKSGNGNIAPRAVPGVPAQFQQKSQPVEAQSKVVVESGKGKPGGLSFGRQDEAKREPHLESRHAQPAAPQQQARTAPRNQQSDRPNQSSQAQPRSEKQGNAAPKMQPAMTETRAPRPISTGARSKNEGVLVGWLVDFKDGKGQGIELREGQFFITRTKLKDNDFVLEHDSISTPHALVRITTQSGVEFQDLMSEKGIQLQRREADSFKPQEERARLNHGDKIRIGDLEYLIVLIPQKGQKVS